MNPFSTIRDDLLALCLIAATSVCAGLVINQFRDARLSLTYQSKEARLMDAIERMAASKPPAASDSQALPGFFSLEKFQDFVEKRQGIILDARPEIFHRLGHVPGAISLPREDFENAYQANRNALEADKAISIVIYCSGGHCEDSELVQKALEKLGYTRVAVFRGGWAEWTEANLLEEKKE